MPQREHARFPNEVQNATNAARKAAAQEEVQKAVDALPALDESPFLHAIAEKEAAVSTLRDELTNTNPAALFQAMQQGGPLAEVYCRRQALPALIAGACLDVEEARLALEQARAATAAQRVEVFREEVQRQDAATFASEDALAQVPGPYMSDPAIQARAAYAEQLHRYDATCAAWDTLYRQQQGADSAAQAAGARANEQREARNEALVKLLDV